MTTENTDELFLESKKAYRAYCDNNHPAHRCGFCKYVTTDEDLYAQHLLTADHKDLKRQWNEAWNQICLEKGRKHAKDERQSPGPNTVVENLERANDTLDICVNGPCQEYIMWAKKVQDDKYVNMVVA